MPADRFHHALENGHHPLAYEAVAPAIGKEGVAFERMERLLTRCPGIDALAVPEVMEEYRDGKQVIDAKPRVDGAWYAAELQRRYGVPAVAYRVVAHPKRTAEDNRDWLLRSWNEYGIRSVVLVGGQRSEECYPCTVPAMNQLAAELNAEGRTDYAIGNICIPSRRDRKSGRLDEAGRMTAKVTSGAQFFTTQILFDPSEVTYLLSRLPEDVEPAILLCFSPLTRPEHLDFAHKIGCNLSPSFRVNVELGLKVGRSLEEVTLASIKNAFARIRTYAQDQPARWGVLVSDLGRRSNERPAEELLSFFVEELGRPASL